MLRLKRIFPLARNPSRPSFVHRACNDHELGLRYPVRSALASFTHDLRYCSGGSIFSTWFPISVRLYRVVNGNRVKFGEEINLPLSVGTWYTLRVEHRRDKIKVYVNDEALIIEKETHFQKAGRIGLYANENANTFFDDFEARSMGEIK